MINEINYKSSPAFDTEDWVELHNFGDTPVDISGWILKDADDSHSFIVPANRIIAAHSYLVLCRNKLAFGSVFPNVNNCAGNFDSGFDSEGELIRLCDASGQLIDSLHYAATSPWPASPNGEGYMLELRDPRLDNALAQSWTASTRIGGTPGAANSGSTSVSSQLLQPALSFKLFQNYPNPFNQQTHIQFSLPHSDWVTLKIFNI